MPLAQVCPLGHVPQLSVPPQPSGTVPQFTPSWTHVWGVQVATQAPATQAAPAGQALPQAPQLLGSVVTLAQAPAQTIWPAGQVQVPETQAAPAEQTLPQAPQLLGSVDTLTQAPLLHLIWPGGHGGKRQAPFRQTAPAGQALPQAPQLLGSIVRSTQAVPHRVNGGVHCITVTQVLLTQLAPGWQQTLPHIGRPSGQVVVQAPFIQTEPAGQQTFPQTGCPDGQTQTGAAAAQTKVGGQQTVPHIT